MRLYSGVSNVTNPEMGGTRRETLAYDRYLDFLALFHNNGSVYDVLGQVALQGIIKITFDGGVYLGWFTSFSVTEDATKAFMFQLSMDFDIAEEVQVWRTQAGATSAVSEDNAYEQATDAGELGYTSLKVTIDDFLDAQDVTGTSRSGLRDALLDQDATFFRQPDGTLTWMPGGDD